MIYLVSKHQELFETDKYSRMSLPEAVSEISTWTEVQVDTETSGRNPHLCKILCIQFGNDDADKQIVVDTTTEDILAFKNILESKPLVGQNLKTKISALE